MITGARPVIHGPAHFYHPSGKAVWDVPCVSKPGERRPTTVRDARKLGLWPSPTTVVKLLHRHALVEWLVEQAVLAAVTTPRKEGEELDAFIERILHTDRVQDEERNAAADKGREIHKAIQEALLGHLPRWENFTRPVLEALNALGRCVATEKTLIGDGYCGTTDCLLEGQDIWVIDYKTCRTIPASPYDEHKLQVSAYCAALGNTGDKVVRGALVYISTKETGLISVKEVDWQNDYRRFQLLLQFYKLTANL